MELAKHLKILLKWWWLLAIATLLAFASSYYVVQRQPSVYQATATLMVGSALNSLNPSGNELSLSQQLAGTYVTLANRTIVREGAMEALGLPYLPEYYVRPVQNSQLLEISVNDTSPERAQAVANTLAEQLVLQSPSASDAEEQEREAFVDEQLNTLQASINETEDEIVAKQDELANAFSAREIAELEGEVAALQTKLTTLQANYAAMLANTQRGATNTITFVEPASLPVNPIAPNRPLIILAASAISFVMAVGAAYLLEAIDDRIKTVEDIRKVTDLRILPGIMNFPTKKSNSELITLTQPLSLPAETFRALRSALETSEDEEPIESFMITSAQPGEGKSVTTANLAVSLAQGGRKVLLVDADLRRPSMDTLFQTQLEPGFVDLLLFMNLNRHKAGALKSLLEDVTHKTQEPSLHVISRGSNVSDSFNLLASEAFHIFLELAREEYDIVVFDAPPILAVNDPITLGRRVDATLMLVRGNRLRRKYLRNAIDRLQDGHVSIHGIVLVGANHYERNYYSYYRNYNESTSDEPRSERINMADVQTGDEQTNPWLREWTARASENGGSSATKTERR